LGAWGRGLSLQGVDFEPEVSLRLLPGPAVRAVEFRPFGPGEGGRGEDGVAWIGGVRAKEGFGGETVGEFAFVPQGEPRVVNAALDMDAAAVGFVDEGVQEGFAQGLAGI
jgi:hypothetical protein